MSEILIAEAPGAIGDTAQCPYCSRMHPLWDPDTGDKVAAPVNCRRCGSPMDPGESREWALSQQVIGEPKRRTRKV